MIPIKQTIFSGFEQPGNSMTACYASYFDKKLKECPDFSKLSKEELSDWLEDIGYESESSANNVYERGDVEDDFYIVYGNTSRNEDFFHFVIMHEGKLFHDPHPSNLGLSDIAGYIYFEKIYEEIPEEKVDPEKEVELVEEKKVSNEKVDEVFLEKIGLIFTKIDAYTGRPLYKLTLEKSLLAEITITAQRLSSFVNHPDKEAWVFIYNEIGKGNSRMSKKIYFKRDAVEFIRIFSWMNGMN